MTTQNIRVRISFHDFILSLELKRRRGDSFLSSADEKIKSAGHEGINKSLR